MRYFNALKIWVLTLFLLHYSVFAQQVTLDVAVGLSKPPYVFQKSNTGFELELIQHLFKEMGFDTKFYYTEFGHSSKLLEVDEIDVVITTNQQVFKNKAQLTDIYITYQNVAITRKQDNLNIDSIDDIGQYTVASFQKSEKVLGAEFLAAVEKAPLFLKIAQQEQQLNLLRSGRVQVLVMDINIFKYYARKAGMNELETDFTFHEVFPDTNYRVAFKDKEKIASFNQTLALFLESDDYVALKAKYGF